MYECRHEILSKNKLLELVKSAQKGCMESQEKIITHNIKLVEKFAQPYIRFAEKEELVQEGVIGICEAIDKFDTSKNVSFITYASLRIKKRMFYFLKENRTIKIPHWVYETENIDEHRKRTEIDSFETIKGDSLKLEELIGKKDIEIEKIENRDIIDRLFFRLSEQEQYVILENYNQDKTLAEIGKKLGISRERVRQIKCNAINKMKKRGIEDGIKFRKINR